MEKKTGGITAKIEECERLVSKLKKLPKDVDELVSFAFNPFSADVGLQPVGGDKMEMGKVSRKILGYFNQAGWTGKIEKKGEEHIQVTLSKKDIDFTVRLDEYMPSKCRVVTKIIEMDAVPAKQAYTREVRVIECDGMVSKELSSKVKV